MVLFCYREGLFIYASCLLRAYVDEVFCKYVYIMSTYFGGEAPGVTIMPCQFTCQL